MEFADTDMGGIVHFSRFFVFMETAEHEFLRSLGADIEGEGTPRVVVNGVAELHGTDYTVIPDRIEAGTYMIAVAATGVDVTVTATSDAAQLVNATEIMHTSPIPKSGL